MTVSLVPTADTWEHWLMEHQGDGYVTIKSYFGTYLSAANSGQAVLSYDHYYLERWAPCPFPNDVGYFIINDWYFTYLSGDNTVVSLKPQKFAWERFNITLVS
eukprot:TRINITY_DN165_c0_g1_i3.p2 TRINITY_DN165_c0_g1~~TRINITY_DN165_c0_g1_i3.p2  ORF type:complete len:103 (+),score=10.80 TRINITY_DN165_c0_g1_i3:497-805(+)